MHRRMRACRSLRCSVRRWIHSQQRVRDALREAREQLPTHKGDAKALVAHALQPPLTASNDVFLDLERQLTRDEAQTLSAALERRRRGEPLAYVTGSREFWSLPFRVSPATLIPRSDSEVLIETLAAQYPPDSVLHILDVGTGSGCLLLAALTEFPHATGVGIDIASDALHMAQLNARDLGLTERASFLQCDLRALRHLNAQEEEEEEENKPTAIDRTRTRTLFQQFDVVLCNPPYIPESERHLVAPDVLAYEPHVALFSDGPDVRVASVMDHVDTTEAGRRGTEDPHGLKMYRWLQESVGHLLKPAAASSASSCPAPQLKRSVILEVGSEAQAHAVQAVFAAPSTRHLSFQRLLMDGQQRHRGLLFESS